MPEERIVADDALWARWTDVAKRQLEGRTIVRARYLTREEAEAFGWSRRCVILTLDNGDFIVPQSDDEGNDAGVLQVVPQRGNATLLPVL